MTKIVKVTKEDIRLGTTYKNRISPDKCMVARALKRALKTTDVLVGSTMFNYSPTEPYGRVYLPLPDTVSELIRCGIEGGHNIKPFSFEVEI